MCENSPPCTCIACVALYCEPVFRLKDSKLCAILTCLCILAQAIAHAGMLMSCELYSMCQNMLILMYTLMPVFSNCIFLVLDYLLTDKQPQYEE